MKESIISALKTKYSNLGFSDRTFTGVADYLATTVQDETQIETAITGVEPLLKALQGDIDSRVTAAVKKRETELKAAQQKQEPQPQTTAHSQPPSDDVPAWAKAMMQKLETFEKKESQAQLMAKLQKKLTDKVPETYLRGRQINIETESDIDNIAHTIEADYTAFKQELINQGVFVENPKSGSSNAKAGVEFAIAEAKRRNEGGSANNPVPGIKL